MRMHIEVKTNGKRGQEIVLRDECMERCTSHEISTIWSQMEFITADLRGDVKTKYSLQWMDSRFKFVREAMFFGC